MKTTLICIGRTNETYWQAAIGEYTKRLRRYSPFEFTEIADLKNAKSLTEAQIKEAEGGNILRQLTPEDYVALLDDKGVQYTSLQFADWYRRRALSGCKRLVFVIGGPYGFSSAVYARANEKLSLSLMTFSHQIVRPLFLEQLYRANTILRNEPYHHE
ncbi:MAG: 23S rRNA (pseudouridine(1915)-N(3))-methyltransferase RlmH [Paludibacteraceae bacterium]|nr:23S rRNA (pseudouridine(1915)-N(3))-methyltransferase RlmH [Paludibacteraceae bacterium]